MRIIHPQQTCSLSLHFDRVFFKSRTNSCLSFAGGSNDESMGFGPGTARLQAFSLPCSRGGSRVGDKTTRWMRKLLACFKNQIPF